MTIVEVIDPGNGTHMVVWKEFKAHYAEDDAAATYSLASCFDPPISSEKVVDEQWPQGWMLMIEEKIRKWGKG